MTHPEGKYRHLPEVSEHIAEVLIDEVSNSASLLKYDFDSALKSVIEEVDWLKTNKDFLGRAVEVAVDSSLNLFSDRLTHKDWIELRTLLLKGVLLVLQAINEALHESHYMGSEMSPVNKVFL